MPQLVKGGKFVFGWSKVHPDGRIRIPDDALKEYDLSDEEKVILMSGSKKSGGFGITTIERLKNSKLNDLIVKFLQKEDNKEYNLNSLVILNKNRMLAWAEIKPGGFLKVKEKILKSYGVSIGDELLSVRGSSLALGIIIKGSIYDEAKKHHNIQRFY
ncbi:MAG: hypothetical protein P8Y97_06605 [Candidatus Lokiarchaeota archaeon]